MASKARFGRIPRAAPSLTATIVALAQQYQAVRESNIVDAWKNGGEFEGKPVHDKDILKWFTDRRNELSPGDPKWDYYNNQVQQYQFSIENSKMELKYADKKATNSEMAHFYNTWAGKLPTDSEAYRVREKLAAAYIDRANTASSAGRRAAANNAYANTINGDFKKEFGYDQTLAFLESEAHNRGILGPGETLGNIDPLGADGTRINQLWNEIATSKEFAPQRAFYTAQIKRYGDPNFNGDFSQNGFNRLTRIKTAAVDNRIVTATHAGKKGDVKTFTNQKGDIRSVQITTGGFDATQQYEDARKAWLDVYGNRNSLPLDIEAANNKYLADLQGIASELKRNLRPGDVDDRLGLINNEIGTMQGGEAAVAHWGGAFGPGGNTGLAMTGNGVPDSTATARGVKQNAADIANLMARDNNNNPLYVLMKVDGNGGPVATTPANHFGTGWGVVAVSALKGNDIFVVQKDGGGDPRSGQIVTAIGGTDIHVSLRNPTTGAVTNAAATQRPAGRVYTMPDGTIGYQIQDSTGHWIYTPDNPFAVNQRQTDGTTKVVPLQPFVDSKGGTITVDTTGTVVPSGAGITAQQYWNPDANVAMTRTSKSGYGLQLLTADPKDDSVYTESPNAIMTTLRAEAASNNYTPQDLMAMVQDVDGKRAVYLGNSTIEQQRIRNNALTGTPNPVPITDFSGLGFQTPSAEGGLINRLVGGNREETIANVREANAVAAGSRPLPGVTTDQPPVDPSWLARKNTLAPSPPSPAGVPTQSPTALGAFIPSQIASTLTGMLGQLTKAATLPGRVGPPSTGPVYNTAPPAAPPPGAPKPTAPTPGPAPTTPTPTATPLQQHVITDASGNYIGVHTGGKYGPTAI